MKNLLMLVLALVALGTVTTPGLAQEPRAIKIDSTMPVQPRIPTLACCECLGKVTTLDLSTGRASPKDPIWSVNGTFAYTTPKVSSWIALPNANWIQPSPSPLPDSNIIGKADYTYTVRFYVVPGCTIPNSVRLSGNFAADNSATATLDKVPIPGALCPGPVCFNTPQAPVPLNGAPPLAPGWHTLEIIVHNISGYSGLIVNAKLTRECVRGTSGPAVSQPTEPAN